jgi:hypothetical protein
VIVTKKQKIEIVQAMKVGDPYTFIRDEPIYTHDSGGVEPVQIGDTIAHCFSTAEPARAFRVKAIHHETVYETEFVGFFVIDHEANTTRILPDFPR